MEAMETHLSGCMVPACCPEPSFRKACTMNNERTMNQSIHGEQRSNDEPINPWWATIEWWTSQSTVNNDRTMNKSMHGEQRSNDEQVNPQWTTIERWTSQSTVSNDRTMNQSIHGKSGLQNNICYLQKTMQSIERRKGVHYHVVWCLCLKLLDVLLGFCYTSCCCWGEGANAQHR